jgi:hypothetical protein
MGDTSESDLVKNTASANNNTTEQEEEEEGEPGNKISSLSPTSPVDLIRRMRVGIGLAVYIAAERRRGRRDQQPDGKQTRNEAKQGRRVQLPSKYQ